jgi:hypothetical protein
MALEAYSLRRRLVIGLLVVIAALRSSSAFTSSPFP